MQLQELLPRRRMVRHCAPEPMPSEALDRIVATVRRAPSAGYSQGQRLLVAPSYAGRATIRSIFDDAGRARPGELEPCLESAPVHVLVCTRW